MTGLLSIRCPSIYELTIEQSQRLVFGHTNGVDDHMATHECRQQGRFFLFCFFHFPEMIQKISFLSYFLAWTFFDNFKRKGGRQRDAWAFWFVNGVDGHMTTLEQEGRIFCFSFYFTKNIRKISFFFLSSFFFSFSISLMCRYLDVINRVFLCGVEYFVILCYLFFLSFGKNA